MRDRILTGDIKRTLAALSAPMIFSQIVQIIYNLVDSFWLGRLGKAALATPAISWPLLFTVVMFGAGFSTAGLALISQYVGAGKWERVNRVAGNLLSFLGLLAVIAGIIGYIWAPGLLHLIGAPSDVFPLALQYLRILFLALPFSFGSFVFGVVLRAVGDTWTPTKINVAALTLNAIIDPFFIFGWAGLPQMGVVGAAVATALSNALASIVGVALLFSGWKHVHLHFCDLWFDWKVLPKMLRIGMPAALSQSLNGVAFSVIMAIVSSFGSAAVAAYGIGMRIINLISAVTMGLSRAAAVMIGQNIGAEQYERARIILLTTVRITTATATVLAVLVFALRQPLVRIFISDPAVVTLGTALLFYFSLSVPFFGIFFPVMNALRAAGKTKISAALGIVRLWVLRVGLAYLFARICASATGAFFGMALANVISGLIAAYFVFWTGWMEKVID
jgi:putative MATE family efflux protein